MQLLAAELRELRRAAGLPTYRELARRTGGQYSAATLSRAASGGRLPSLACTLAYAEACGAAREEWARRWRRAAAEVRGDRSGRPPRRSGALPPGALPPAPRSGVVPPGAVPPAPRSAPRATAGPPRELPPARAAARSPRELPPAPRSGRPGPARDARR